MKLLYFILEKTDLHSSDKTKSETSKPIYYKDTFRQELNGNLKSQPKVIGETPIQEQERLKTEFKKAAEAMQIENKEDDLFQVKKKHNDHIKDENAELEKLVKIEKRKGKLKEVDLLEQFWGDENRLDDTDKFLKKYILGKGWVDPDENEELVVDPKVDEEDEQRDEEMEDFEEKYNFRYEEQGADRVISKIWFW